MVFNSDTDSMHEVFSKGNLRLVKPLVKNLFKAGVQEGVLGAPPPPPFPTSVVCFSATSWWETIRHSLGCVGECWQGTWDGHKGSFA